MRWPVFALFAYLALGIQVGLASAFSFEMSKTIVEPRFVLILAVFIGLHARGNVAILSWLILGFLMDMTVVYVNNQTVLGPYTLGYLTGGYFLSNLKPLLYARHPMSLAVGTFAAGFAVHLIVIAVFTLKMWYDPMPNWSAKSELFLRCVALGYTAVIAAVLALPMYKLSGVFGFHAHKRSTRR